MSRLAWHFLRDNGELRDGTKPPPDGEWLSVDGDIRACSWGLHASERILDALGFAPGSVICRVEVRGDIREHGRPPDKLVARERRILWRLDAEIGGRVLREFARWAALQVIDLWDAPAVVREYLETGDESLRYAARSAAGPAAGDAAWDAARDAAWAAQNAKLEALVTTAAGRTS